jgi:hypothetical protein
MNEVHLVRAGSVWQLRDALDGEVLRTDGSQADAQLAAGAWILGSGGGVVVVHRADGAVSTRIRYGGRGPTRPRRS